MFWIFGINLVLPIFLITLFATQYSFELKTQREKNICYNYIFKEEIIPESEFANSVYNTYNVCRSVCLHLCVQVCMCVSVCVCHVSVSCVQCVLVCVQCVYTHAQHTLVVLPLLCVIQAFQVKTPQQHGSKHSCQVYMFQCFKLGKKYEEKNIFYMIFFIVNKVKR